MVVAKKYIYVKEYDGLPKDENVKIVEETLPSLKDGGKSLKLMLKMDFFLIMLFYNLEYLVEAVYLSVDPYMRAYAPNYKINDTLIGTQVAK